MAVPNTTYQTSFTGDGVTTVFGFTWTATSVSQIQVYINGVLQVSGYTVALSNITNGGTVTFAAAPINGAVGLLQRQSDLLQTTDLLNNASLPADAIEAMIDKLTIIAQQQATQINECIQLPAGTVGINTTLPVPVPDAVFAWNSSATALVNIAVPFAPATTVANTIAIWDATTNQALDNGPAVGSIGQILMSQGAGSPPHFSAAPGAAGTLLTSNGTGVAPTFQPFAPSTGTLTGPVSSTQYSLAMWGTSATVLTDGPALGASTWVLTSNGPGMAPSFQALAPTAAVWTHVPILLSNSAAVALDLSGYPTKTWFDIGAVSTNVLTLNVTNPLVGGEYAFTLFNNNVSTTPLAPITIGAAAGINVNSVSVSSIQINNGPAVEGQTMFFDGPASHSFGTGPLKLQSPISSVWTPTAFAISTSAPALPNYTTGSLFLIADTHSGGSGPLLPTVASIPLGTTYRFYTVSNSSSEAITLTASGSDTITGPGSTSIGTVGAYREIIAMSSTKWLLNTL